MSACRNPVVFEAVVRPPRSLSARGLWLALGAICAVTLGLIGLSWSLGAWPIAGFCGAEIMLAASLLRIYGRSLRRSEMLLLSDDGLRIVSDDGKGGRSEQVLQAAWLRATLEERPGRAPCLYLSARGRRLEVAALLGEPEKRDLFEALAAALDRLRHPVFDNAQL